MKTIFKFLPFLLLTAFIASCSDDDSPAPVNEEEVITTLRITFTPQGGGTQVVFQSQDLDGDGPNAPVVSIVGDLQTGTTYNGAVEVLNELETPAEDITEEVMEEDDEHQFFYTITGGAGPAITYNDSDGDGNPVGLSIILTTGANSTINVLTVTLRHEPDKDASGVSDGDITNAGGETDVEATFNFTVN
ncbi:MAG: type 1 periplasmic binding fold superfamily protein [Flavobacteriaceae bacterium]